jgi:hypothetical protein
MATVDKNFKVKNGLNVAGTATFGSTVVLGETPLRFDTATNKLQIQLNEIWVPIAFNSDIPDTSQDISFMDIGLAIDYDGSPTYIVQANGVTPTGISKFINGGDPSSTDADVSIVFDSGSLV